MPGRRTILDDQFDEVGRLAFKGLQVRLPTAAITVVLLGVNVGVALAATWLAALLTIEAWGYLIGDIVLSVPKSVGAVASYGSGPRRSGPVRS